jgi:hypothetical protein
MVIWGKGVKWLARRVRRRGRTAMLVESSKGITVGREVVNRRVHKSGS